MKPIQRWYVVEHWRIGKGAREREQSHPMPSRAHAEAWAKFHGLVPRSREVFGTKSRVYRVTEIEKGE